MQAYKPETGISLIDGAVGLDPGIKFGHFLAIGQARKAAIAGARIDAIKRYHPAIWLLAQKAAHRIMTAMNCNSTRSRISLFEFDRPKSPPRNKA